MVSGSKVAKTVKVAINALYEQIGEYKNNEQRHWSTKRKNHSIGWWV